MRDQDQMLRDREVEFLDRFRANLERCHVNPHLRTRPIDHEWVDPGHFLVHLNDVEQINEMDIRCLQEALAVQNYWTISPLHLNRMRISFLCRVSPRPHAARPTDPDKRET